MTSLQKIKQTCPIRAWKQHRFCSDYKLVGGKTLSLRFEIYEDKPYLLSIQDVRDKYTSIFGDELNDPNLVAALTAAINLKIKMTATILEAQTKAVERCLDAIQEGSYLQAYTTLRALVVLLKPYQSQLWLYEWVDWVAMVEDFIRENADQTTLDIINQIPDLPS